MVSLKQGRGEICQSILAQGWTAPVIAQYIRDIAEQEGIPAKVTVSEATTGGLFGSTFPCVVIEHPNPPQQYFDHWVIINGDVINFQYGGMSTATYNMNLKEERRNSGKLTGMLMGAMMSDSSMELQTEHVWHNQIKGIYQQIWFSEN